MNRSKPPKIKQFPEGARKANLSRFAEPRLSGEPDPVASKKFRKGRPARQGQSYSVEKSGGLPENPRQNEFTFQELPGSVRKILTEAGIETPTEVQKLCFDPIRQGRDLLARSETGTGKTLAFCLPMAGHYVRDRGRRVQEATPTTLILCPTRELAQQVASVFNTYLRPFKRKTGVLVGGEAYRRQSQYIRFGVDVVVGTPGRVADFLRKGDLSLSCVDRLILDEVDQILDVGFEKEVNFIQEKLRRKVQTLFFSATLNKKARKLAERFLADPVQIRVEDDRVADRITHSILPVTDKTRFKEFTVAIEQHQPVKALVFCETKAGCDGLAERLLALGYRVSVIHGELSQQERQIALGLLKKDHIRFLISTNVAARGIDIVDLPLVVNYNLPKSARDYTHRTGRTARAGKQGAAWNLVARSDSQWFREICNRVGIKLSALNSINPDN